MVYLNTGAGFAIDTVRGNFDVDQWEAKHSEMKPWEVRNAEEATTRRTHLLQWMRAASSHSPTLNSSYSSRKALASATPFDTASNTVSSASKIGSWGT